jgi:hypothetical protein
MWGAACARLMCHARIEFREKAVIGDRIKRLRIPN